MSIKEAIGKRIADSRRAAGLTIKDLADRTGGLKSARISNWEQGTRMPGPIEAKVLADALGVKASYILCLSDEMGNEDGLQGRIMPRTVPILTSEQALQPPDQAFERFLSKLESVSLFDRVPLGKNVSSHLSDSAFAIVIQDDSMAPDFSKGDTVIADPALAPKPGDYVIAEVKSQPTAMVRKFRESRQGFELHPLNPNWASMAVESVNDGRIIATIIEHRRIFR